MVAKIESGKSLIGALNYNERKVKAGKAVLIAAVLYPKEIKTLSLEDKLFRLTDLAGRNERVRTNTVHLSLNFDLSENLPTTALIRIADSYMNKIGFGQQPYLVYEHFDAGHNHIHILTTNIEASGNRISLHNIGKLKSEPARKAVELEFGLVQAEKQHLSQIAQSFVEPLVYGAVDTKRAISTIVNQVARSYKFTTVPELNAALAVYNVMADRGPKDSVMYKNEGLRYWALDPDGNKIGVPLKASSLYKKPTLKLLEEHFKLNSFLRKPFRAQLTNILDEQLLKANSLQELKEQLFRQNVDLVVRQTAEGRLYGLTFVDRRNQVVFNGSDLGKIYSAGAIEARLNKQRTQHSGKESGVIRSVSGATQNNNAFTDTVEPKMGLLDTLLSPAEQTDSPSLFYKRKKKKRKKLKI